MRVILIAKCVGKRLTNSEVKFIYRKNRDIVLAAESGAASINRPYILYTTHTHTHTYIYPLFFLILFFLLFFIYSLLQK